MPRHFRKCLISANACDTYSARHLIGSRIIESAAYCNQILLVLLYFNSTQNMLVHWIILLLWSLLCWPKVILLSDEHCTSKQTTALSYIGKPLTGSPLMNHDRFAGGWLFHDVHIGLILSPKLYSSFTAEIVGFRLGVSEINNWNFKLIKVRYLFHHNYTMIIP